jgi:hypothetical protein
MNDKVIVIDFRSADEKMRDFKDKFIFKLRKGRDWVVKNKDWLITLTPIIIGGVTSVAIVVGKRANLHKEEELKELYCYDRSLGHYWRLKRELSNKEWLEIDTRKKNGERLADILAELKVLK